MALTIIEQLNIINGDPRPTAYTLEELTKQVAVNFAEDFLSTVKQFDLGANEVAASYKNKMLNTCRIILRESLSVSPLVKILVASYNGVFADVENATDPQWVTFLENNIQVSLEKLSGVEAEEKTAYDAI